jgi:hypothetical protein
MARHKRRIPVPRELEKLTRMIEELGDRHDTHRVFNDFCEMAAISISNAVDRAQREAREARYMEIIGYYKRRPEDVQLFPKMLAELVMALERTGEDVLGPVSAAIGMCDYRSGAFWTPWNVSYMMAKILVHDIGKTHEPDLSEPRGFITAAEPACGPGGMILAFAKAFQEELFNPQQQLHFTAVDVSRNCVHMTYVQTALSGIPATVILGNSLSQQFSEFWYTPAHIMGNFSYRLRRKGLDETNGRWWADATMPDRIRFLKSNELDVGLSAHDRAARAVLDAVASQPPPEKAQQLAAE